MANPHLDADLAQTVFHDLHVELGAKMVPFAGYSMPVQYPLGVMKEHLHTRTGAGLFDVSHMGQVILRGDNPATALERLVPVSIVPLKEGRQRYALFTNEDGGILDDLMVANRGDHLFLVVNAACKEADVAHMKANLADCEVEVIEDRALLALQGPKAEAALAAFVPSAADMVFMDVAVVESDFGELWISRSGYTGEDGYEISVSSDSAVEFARALLAQDGVEPIGLGARDSLRLEAGLCLYGNDIDETTTPVEAALEWAMQKARRTGGEREGGFPGAERILAELEKGATRRRVGILPEGRAPMRAGTQLFASADATEPMGQVTSGAFGPSIERPMSMGYVAIDHAETGTVIYAEVRGKRLPATVADMPFRPSTYKR
ncbi:MULTISPECIES: glycine cleavage system aminomethyltransferase GcvT [Halocynthiibacter]|uniref:aminomethyltransferase n=1 Tax=Halocynthiibacter halioticoli TaxID=2986804 RepID=A0AAE3LUB6_9RHOB|nr:MULTISPECIES: glycine cleavage system aminomethyltransferase GcvT [Halocynthiibacter]MCV6823545.1 glycine cleavage system aminomethyltransferase GcvT [Halocynthiibacter halioticoli]MCW4056546.1 glycine cleavage system aminomethyltransferase GcvT [Halocynthiibacter sp. SDUM655004]